MPPVTGLSTSSYNSLVDGARRTIATYDRNGDGRISPTEANQRVVLGNDSYSFTNRVSSDYVNRTTVYTQSIGQGLSSAVADAGHGADASAEDLVNAYLTRKDGNRDGKLSFWERMTVGAGGLREMFETTQTVETDRRTKLQYDPEPTYVTPPAPDYRPAPPSVYPSAPTPPSPGYRPTPPPVTNPYSRPAPSSGSNGRPTPPRA